MTRSRGRPRTGAAVPAAARMRAYRRRLRERGVVPRTVSAVDPVASAVRFAKDTLLTPTERDVVRRFCAGLRRLPQLPLKVAIFGSRASGGSGVDSDLDVAVLMGCARAQGIERSLAALAHRAHAPYQGGDCAIRLRPVAVFAEDQQKGFFSAIRNQMEPVWTRPH
ncbi:MAG: nucleotidyltransferase domain-containing protein [Burkholderiales bacterium]